MSETGKMYKTIRKSRLEDHGTYCDNDEVFLGYNMFTEYASFGLRDSYDMNHFDFSVLGENGRRYKLLEEGSIMEV